MSVRAFPILSLPKIDIRFEEIISGVCFLVVEVTTVDPSGIPRVSTAHISVPCDAFQLGLADTSPSAHAE
jgi:hypothetical protein